MPPPNGPTPSVKASSPAMAEEKHPIEALLDGTDKDGSLRSGWVGLQVFCEYANNLPTDEATLKILLNTASVGQFSFSKQLIVAYGALRSTSKDFITHTFTEIIQLGSDIKAFADDAKDPDGDLGFILDEVSKGTKDGLSNAAGALRDKINEAVESAKSANKVKEKLSTFKVELNKAQTLLDGVKKSLGSDIATSEASIDTINGGANLLGSLKHLQDRLAKANKLYTHDRLVAETSPTYFLLIPWGTIAAIVVAATYGKKAADDLILIKSIKNEIKQADTDLANAVTLHATQNLAQHGVENTLYFAGVAANHVTVIQNYWEGFSAHLKILSQHLEGTEVSEPEGASRSSAMPRLKGRALVEHDLKLAIENWKKLAPALKLLMDNAYITVDPNNDIPKFEQQLADAFKQEFIDARKHELADAKVKKPTDPKKVG